LWNLGLEEHNVETNTKSPSFSTMPGPIRLLCSLHLNSH
jgi:hypothetical protein